MVLTRKHSTPKPKSNPSPSPISAGKQSSNVITRSFGAYFPRASAQVQPRPPEVNVNDLLNLVDQLRDRESALKTELVELKLLREAASIVPSLEAEIHSKTRRIDELLNRVTELSSENEKLVVEREVLKAGFEADLKVKDARIASLMTEIDEVKQLSNSQRFLRFVDGGNKCSSSSSNNYNNVKWKSSTTNLINGSNTTVSGSCNSNAVKLQVELVTESPPVRCLGPRVPKPPPKRCVSESSSSSSSSSLLPAQTPPPPPPPPPAFESRAKVPPAPTSVPPPPPPPPPPRSGVKVATTKVKRVPEVVEFYHSLMRRDSRRDSCVGTADVTSSASAKDLVGEIENRSVYLLAIKTDVETQKEFIRFLIKEVETAAFTNIEDVVSFVKWLDDELSYLVDERAVLKHFDWPEQKSDALREAAFEYSDLKKLESEASSFRHDARQACSTTLKKMQTLLEKLEHGVYNLSRLRESATNRFKSFHIPVDWMLDTGFVSQIKLASVKLAMKYMKRVSAELEIVGSGPEEEELIIQGVRFAFRVHQFARGFDAETMKAFEELRDKARSYHVQCQNQQQQQQRLACRSMPC